MAFGSFLRRRQPATANTATANTGKRGARTILSRGELDGLAADVTAGVDRDLVAAWHTTAARTETRTWRNITAVTGDHVRGSVTVTFDDGHTLTLAVPADVADLPEQLATMVELETTRAYLAAHGPLVLVRAVSDSWHVDTVGTPATGPVDHA